MASPVGKGLTEGGVWVEIAKVLGAHKILVLSADGRQHHFQRHGITKREQREIRGSPSTEVEGMGRERWRMRHSIKQWDDELSLMTWKDPVLHSHLGWRVPEILHSASSVLSWSRGWQLQVLFPWMHYQSWPQRGWFATSLPTHSALKTSFHLSPFAWRLDAQEGPRSRAESLTSPGMFSAISFAKTSQGIISWAPLWGPHGWHCLGRGCLFISALSPFAPKSLSHPLKNPTLTTPYCANWRFKNRFWCRILSKALWKPQLLFPCVSFCMCLLPNRNIIRFYFLYLNNDAFLPLFPLVLNDHTTYHDSSFCPEKKW